MNGFLIIVMDVGQPKYIDSYNEESKIIESFILYLNQKLIDLKQNGSKIVVSNYIGNNHPLLTVQPDFETTSDVELELYIKNNQFLKIIYVGLHYPVCTHIGRPTSSHLMKKRCPEFDIYVCPFLTRPLRKLYGMIAQTDNETDIKQIML